MERWTSKVLTALAYNIIFVADSSKAGGLENLPSGVSIMDLQIELKTYYDSIVPPDLPKESDYVRCQIPGVLEAICVAVKSKQGEGIQFCQDQLYDHVCVPLFTPLWPDWSTKVKDELVQEQVALNIEGRFQNELMQNTFDSKYKAVSGLQLTSDVKCMQSFVKFMCRQNFNLCNPTTGEVFPPCMSDCDNAFGKCGVDSARCQDPFQYKNIDTTGGGLACSYP